MKKKTITADSPAAVSYLRYSSDNQTENSIEYQRGEINRYCQENGIRLVREYVDEAYSARTDRRPAFREMMRAAEKSPEWSMVLIHSYNRFARNSGDLQRYYNFLEDRDIQLISVTQRFEDTNEGFLMRGMISLWDEYYSRDNAKHTHAGMMNKAAQGLHCGGIPPLGFDVGSDGKLKINEQEAEAVRLIFTMYEQNYSFSKMAAYLNENGYRSKRGGLFKKTSFYSILSQEKYIGTYSWNKARQKNSYGSRNSRKLKAENEHIRREKDCPIIIEEDQFWRVQEKIASGAEETSHSKARYHYMLGGLGILKCAECGREMTGLVKQSHDKTYTYYTCPGRKRGECENRDIRTKYVDYTVCKLLSDDLMQRDDWDEINRDMQNTEESQRIQDRLRANDTARKNTLRALRTGCTDVITEQLRELTEERKILLEKLEKCEKGKEEITAENCKEGCKKMMYFLRDSDDPAVKSYLREMICEVKVSPDGVTVTMNIK